MAQLPIDERAVSIQETFKRFQSARESWDSQAREDLDFYLGNHFSSVESKELSSRNQAEITIDRIYPAIEQLKAILTSRPPKFSVIAREDSDHKVSNVWKTILEYIWDISDGNEHFKQSIHDYAVCGLGYLYAYVDKESDFGRGDVKFTSVSPFRVYVDPNTRNRYFDDASEIIVSTVLTKEQVLDMYPELGEEDEEGKAIIDGVSGGPLGNEDDWPSATNTLTSGAFTPAEVKDWDYDNTGNKYQLVEMFEKVKVPFYRVAMFTPDSPEPVEKVMTAEEFEKFQNDEEIKILYDNGDVDFEEIIQTRVKVTCALGQIVLFEKILNTDVYPIVPVPNVWTNTAYPSGDVRKVKDVQRFINKMFSLIISHAQSSSGLKLLVPEGSIEDIEQLEKDWANPNAAIEYDASLGEPHFPSPQPLPTSFYSLMQQGEHYIDLNLGIFEMQQGNADAAPRTSSGTMMMEEFGQRRSKSKLRDIEGSLKRLGKVVYNLSKGHYTYKKSIRIVQPNNDITEFTINKRMYSDKTKELQSIQNDIGIGQFDIRVIGNSTLPSNRYGELDLYMAAYQQGIIDRVEVLKKTDIFDKEGVLQRIDDLQKLQQMVQQQEEMIKKLKGDLEAAARESISSKQRTEVEKFKSRLKEDEVRTKNERRNSLGNLETAVKLETERLRNGSQPQEEEEELETSQFEGVT